MDIDNTGKSEMVGFFPPLKSLAIFLLVTLLTLLLNGFTIGTLSLFHFSLEWQMLGILLSLLIFMPINFKITRGSFKCVFYLKIYILFLTFLSLPSLLTYDPTIERAHAVLSFVQISSGLLAFYLIASKTYIQFVQHQCDYFTDLKQAQKEIKNELDALNKSKRAGK